MIQDSKITPIFFPWDGVVPTEGTVLIRDVDVVGVGALRRAQIEKLLSEKEIVLQIHSGFIPAIVRQIYEEELLRTLQWLRPLREQVAYDFDFLKEQKKLFQKMFPLTEQLLGVAANKVRDQYLEEMEWSSWLLQDHWRYLSGYIRQKFPENTELKEIVHWEWVRAWLEIQPFMSSFAADVGTFVLNPTLQIVKLTQFQPRLGKPEGLYAFVFDPVKIQITEQSLDVFEAAFIDLLAEDRKYTREQLLDSVMLVEEIAAKLSKQEWEEKLEKLIDSCLLIQVKSEKDS